MNLNSKRRMRLLLIVALTLTVQASGSENGLELGEIGFKQSNFDAECRFSCPSNAYIFSNNAFERPAVFCWFEQPASGQERNKDTRPLKRNMLRQKESDPNAISEAVIQKEMQFSTEDKIRACIGGGSWDFRWVSFLPESLLVKLKVLR